MLKPCCCGPKVLLWDTNCDATLGGLTACRTEYDALGIPSHLSGGWTGNITDYSVIIWLMAISTPSWFAAVVGGGWSGRLHYSAEYNSFPSVIAFVNTITVQNGLAVGSVNSNGSGGSCSAETSVGTGHTLTDGIATLHNGDTTSVSGGSAVYTSSLLGGAAMMSQVKVGTVDWVLCGDSTHLANHCPGNANLNRVFLDNLYRKPI